MNGVWAGLHIKRKQARDTLELKCAIDASCCCRATIPFEALHHIGHSHSAPNNSLAGHSTWSRLADSLIFAAQPSEQRFEQLLLLAGPSWMSGAFDSFLHPAAEKGLLGTCWQLHVSQA